jgi:hypothetical protein
MHVLVHTIAMTHQQQWVRGKRSRVWREREAKVLSAGVEGTAVC